MYWHISHVKPFFFWQTRFVKYYKVCLILVQQSQLVSKKNNNKTILIIILYISKSRISCVPAHFTCKTFLANKFCKILLVSIE